VCDGQLSCKRWVGAGFYTGGLGGEDMHGSDCFGSSLTRRDRVQTKRGPSQQASRSNRSSRHPHVAELGAECEQGVHLCGVELWKNVAVASFSLQKKI
jgi:hypothetical protein